MPVPVHPVKVALARTGERPSEFAERIGYSKGPVSQVLNGHVTAWPEFRRRAAEALGASETELFPDADRVACWASHEPKRSTSSPPSLYAPSTASNRLSGSVGG